VKEAWLLLDGMTPHVIAEDPRALADSVLVSAGATVRAARAALFQREQDQMVLFASRGIHQGVIDVVTEAWTQHRAKLLAGEPIVGIGPATPDTSRAAREVFSESEAYVVKPVAHAGRVLGLLFIEGPKTVGGSHLGVVDKLAHIAAIALRVPAPPPMPAGPSSPVGQIDSYLERTPPNEVAREQLLVLLERHEWNLSRVARALGITRRTMYLRLDRYGIERKRVSKAIKRREAT
jgi:hypothetical protein